MDECLAYFRQAIAKPLTVPPWSEWWTQNSQLVERVFSRHDVARLRHRRLLGARQILQARGELPEDYQPHDALFTGSCSECGERTVTQGGPGGGNVICPNCGVVCTYDCRRERG